LKISLYNIEEPQSIGINQADWAQWRLSFKAKDKAHERPETTNYYKE